MHYARTVLRAFPLLILAAATLLAACGDDTPDPTPADPTTHLGAWLLTTGNLDGDAIPIPAPERITLTFRPDAIGGVAACNNYGADAEVNGPRLTIGDIAQTAIGCRDNLNDIEAQYLTALAQVDRFEVAADHLVLRGPGVELVFDRLPDAPTAAVVDQTWALEDPADDGPTAPTFLLRSDGTLDAGTGCRTLTGEWVETGDEILATSLRADGDYDACSPALQEQDGRVIDVIGDGFRMRLQGDRLTLTSRDGVTLTLIPAPEPAASGNQALIDGPTLRVVDTINGTVRDLFTVRWTDRSPVDWPDLARWAPDGRTLAVLDARGLWLVEAESGDTRRIRESGRAVDWHPDGDRLAVAGPDGVFEIDRTGVELAVHDDRNAWWVSWSPEGASLAYAGTNGVAVVRPSGDRVQLPFSNFVQLVWAAPDVLVRSASDEDRAFVERYDLRDETRADVVLEATPARPENRFALSEDGAYALRQDRLDEASRVSLWTIANGTLEAEWRAALIAAVLTRPHALVRPGDDLAVLLSRGNCDAAGVEIGIASPAGEFEPLWSYAGGEVGTWIEAAAWAPTGEAIAFVHPVTGLWIIGADAGGEQRPITPDAIGGVYELRWSPDGRWLAGWSVFHASSCA